MIDESRERVLRVDQGTERVAGYSLALLVGSRGGGRPPGWTCSYGWIIAGLRCGRPPVLRGAAPGRDPPALPARPGPLAPGDRVGSARARALAGAAGSTVTAGPGSRSSESATRSGRSSGSAAATCRWSPAIAATISRWPPRCSGARARSSTMSRASSATIRGSARGRACSTTGPRRWTPTCVRWPFGSRAWGRSAALEARIGAAKACSFVLNLLALPALYVFARRRYGCRVAIWAMAVLAVLPVHAIYAGFVLRESLVALLSILAVWMLTEVWHAEPGRRSVWAWAVAAGLCGGLAVLARTTGLALLAAAGLFALVDGHGRRRFGPLLLWAAHCRVVVPSLGMGDLPGIWNAFLFIHSVTSNTTSPGRSTITTRGTRSPSQFYTRQNCPRSCG